jgi:putative copper resistance protein D
MPPDLLAATITRWIGFFAMAALIGSLAVDLLVLRDDGPTLHAGRRRLRRLRVASVIVLVLVSMAEVVLRGRTMTGAGLSGVLSAVPSILGRTHFGHVWVIRFILLAGALCAACSLRRAGRVVTLVAAIGVAFTTAATGHAGDWGDLSLSAAIDWVHVVASSSWVGGLLSLVVAGRSRDVPIWPSPLFETIARRFSRLAGWSLLAVVSSGSYNAWVQVRMPAALWSTTYGRVLCIKVVLVAVIVWLGAASRYTIVARLGHPEPGGLLARLFRMQWAWLFGAREIAPSLLPPRLLHYVSREACLGIVVLACSAILADSTPARHAVHLDHHAASNAMPVNTAELHARGDIPAKRISDPLPGSESSVHHCPQAPSPGAVMRQAGRPVSDDGNLGRCSKENE